MKEMYDMSIVIHNYSVIGILGTILINIIMLLRAKNIKKYERTMSLFIPISMTVLGTVIFTGIVMMAAKHLNFTIENVLMIIFAVVLIVLENTRSKKLQGLDKSDANALTLHKVDAFKIIKIEIVLVLAISIWMWIR
ncbi:hypothetical protein [Sulfurimonas sp. CS5]|jgi:hydrogenase-4 membrane subunit HyfE|uniref:hypothetical protein n=1 Tax=Sulfurimonas sp. CS5 TaxID=3391145 RepID=UPI0039EC43B4